MNTWEARLRAVRRRLLLRGAVEEGSLVGAAAAALWAAGTLAFRFLAGVPPRLSWPWALTVSLLVAALVLLVRLRHRLHLTVAAEASDRFLQSHDLMATALWLHRQRPLPPSGAVVLQQAEAAAANLEARRAAGGPARQVIGPRLAALITAAALGLWASVAPLPLLRTATAPPLQGMSPLASVMAPAEDEPSEDDEGVPGLADSLQRLEQELTEGEASPQGARETLDRLLRGLDSAEPGSGPRSPLSPAEQEELEGLLERVIGRAGPASGLEAEGRPGEAPPEGEPTPSEGGGRGSGESDPGGPGEPTLDPGTSPERPGAGTDGPSGSPEGQPRPGERSGTEPQEGGPGGEGPEDGRGPDGTLPGTGPAPGLDAGDPVEGTGYLPPPAATTGEPDLLPSTPEIGPYGLGEGPRVTPSPGEDPGDRAVDGPGSTPDADPAETPVLQPLLPALYREWLQRYFTPGPS